MSKVYKDYNHLLTKDEHENPFMLQVVESYRKKFPTYKKQDFTHDA